MLYLRILLACAAEPWAIEPNKLRIIAEFLAFQASGEKYEAQEIEARIGKAREQEVSRAPGAVAVLPIFGVLAQRMGMLGEISGGTSVERVAGQFAGLVNDDMVKAIVLQFDSPGGTVNGIDEFAAEIFAARGSKPIVAQVDSLCASAAYYLAAQADEVVVTPGGALGSIGVFGVHEEISRALDKAGVTRTLISSSEKKGAINNFQPLTEEGKAELQKRVDHANDLFGRALARGRNVSLKAVREKFGEGEMFTPPDALARGMADRIAPMKDTLARFGVAALPPRRVAANAVRAAAGARDFSAISPSQFEDALRDALGFSKAQATALAGHGLTVLRLGDPDEARSDSGMADTAAARAAYDRLIGQARGFKL